MVGTFGVYVFQPKKPSQHMAIHSKHTWIYIPYEDEYDIHLWQNNKQQINDDFWLHMGKLTWIPKIDGLQDGSPFQLGDF